MVDEDSEMILGVEVRAGNTSDGDGAAPLLEEERVGRGEQGGDLLGDMAYSDGDVRRRSKNKEPSWWQRSRRSPTGDASPRPTIIDNENKTVTRPAGSTTSETRAVRDHKDCPATAYLFDADTSAHCPLRAQCTTAKEGRQIIVGRHHDRIEAARAAQGEPETEALLRKRPKVERKRVRLS